MEMLKLINLYSGLGKAVTVCRRLFSFKLLSPRPDESPAIAISKDGAWCWFQDPRAIYIDGKYRRTYAGSMTSYGQLQVGAYDHKTGQTEIATLKENWDIDDHNTNSFLVRPDRRIMVFYARHNGRGLYCRTTSEAEDISKWDKEVAVADNRNITYSNPVYLSDEKRFYVFWRGESWKPSFSTSCDGKIWTKPQIFIQEKGLESSKIRPYIKVTANDQSAIHFAFTDDHPRDAPCNSIYYFQYKNGVFYKANGTCIGTVDRLPINHSQSDIVYDGRAEKVRAWVWDIAMDKSGNPVIVYTRLPAETNHRYHYAYWNGHEWLDSEITAAGKWFPQTHIFSREQEPHYSGGIALNQADPAVVYLSRQVGNKFEIEKWTTNNHGRDWSAIAITQKSKDNNVRPVVPRGYTGEADHVLWMQGKYLHYTKYNTRIMLFAAQKRAVP